MIIISGEGLYNNNIIIITNNHFLRPQSVYNNMVSILIVYGQGPYMKLCIYT